MNKKKRGKASKWLVYYLVMIMLTTGLIGYIYLAYSVNATITSPKIETQEHIDTIDDTLYRLLRKYEGVSYQQVYNIVQCESGWDSDAKNYGSTASGYAQFLFNTWYFEVIEQLGWSNLVSPFDGERNLEGLIFLLSEGEEWRWEATAWCWK